MQYKIGTVHTLTFKKVPVKFLLTSYLGQWRDATGHIYFNFKKETPEGHNRCYFEVWEAQNLDTGIIEIQKFPVYLYEETSDEFVDQGRLDVIDDTQEVTSLLDSYDCWLNEERDGQNFHLEIINHRHNKQIQLLEWLEKSDIHNNFKIGVRLKLMMKQTPSWITRRDFKSWQSNYPEHAEKIRKMIYENTYNTAMSIGL